MSLRNRGVLGISGTTPIEPLNIFGPYDVPIEIIQRNISPAFKQFLRNWFVDSRGLSRREVDLSFLNELTDAEKDLARDLLRRNLHLKHTQIIEGLATFEDTESIPILRTMVADEPDLSRRLTIAGTLWRLARDPLFIDLLKEMKASTNATLKQAHIHQIAWIPDERAIDLLIELLDDSDRIVRTWALDMLKSIESGKRSWIDLHQLHRDPEYYRTRRNDSALRGSMVDNLVKRNAESKACGL